MYTDTMIHNMRREYIGCNIKEKIRIAVMFQVASYWPSIESFYEACVSDQGIDIKIYFVGDLSVEKAQIKDTVEFLYKHKISFEKYTERAISEFRPHIALFQPPYDTLYRNPSALSKHLMNMGTRIIYIPYGIEIADTEDAHLAHFHTYVVKNSWRIYTFSDLMKEDYYKYCPNRHAVRVTGSPKFDAIGNRDILMDESIRKKANGRRIILWKMHFPKMIYEGTERRQVTPYLSEYLKFANKLREFADLFFVVMPHPMFFSQTIAEELAEEAKKLLFILEMQPNAVIDLSQDYRNSLYNADAIMIDRSALMVEAGACNVPVFFMRNSDYEEPFTKAVKTLVDTYVQGCTSDDMVEFVLKFRIDGLKDCVGKQKKAFAEVVPYFDGQCGKRIVEDLKCGMKEETDRRTKVVFFGASRTCEHYLKSLNILNNSNYNVLAVSDNSSDKWGKRCEGVEIIPPTKIVDLDFDVLVISAEQFHMPIKHKLVYELFIDEEKIVRLDDFCEQYLYGVEY